MPRKSGPDRNRPRLPSPRWRSRPSRRRRRPSRSGLRFRSPSRLGEPLDILTGAAANWFIVKTAATAAGWSVVAMMPRSGRPEGLMPAGNSTGPEPARHLNPLLDGGLQIREGEQVVGAGGGPGRRSTGFPGGQVSDALRFLETCWPRSRPRFHRWLPSRYGAIGSCSRPVVSGRPNRTLKTSTA